jgi:ribosome-binding protein aMBF1 (putative translation factor)
MSLDCYAAPNMRRKHFSPKSAKGKKTSVVGNIGVVKPDNQEGRAQNARKVEPGEPYERFQRLLVEARKKSGLSQQAVADRLGRPQTYVSKCERRTRRLDVIEFLEMAQAVDFDPVSFIRKLKQT